MVAQQPLPTRSQPASIPPPQARPHTPSVPPPQQTFQPNPISVSAPLPLPPAPAAAPAPMPLPQAPEPHRPTPVVLDVLPRGLGIGTVAGYCEELIRRNSRIPAQMRKTFTTIRDNQDVVQIVVCQGESRRLDANVVLGDLRLEGLPKRPRGETSIEVTFEMDASGILNVRARDVLTNMEQRASLDVVGTLPDDEIAGAQERLKRLTR
jgi:molecular chaperone DnaK